MGAENSTASGDERHAPTAAQGLVDTQEAAWSPLGCQTGDHGPTPSPREAAGGIVHEKFVVFGGHDAQAEHNDVWLQRLGERDWHCANVGGRAPRARSGHTAVAVPGVGLVVFAGLSHEKGYLSDVALLSEADDGALTWAPVCATGTLPAGRDKHSSVLVPAGGEGGWTMLTFGGFGVQPKTEDESDEDEDDEDEDEDASKKEAPGASRTGGGEGEGNGEDADADDADADGDDDDGGSQSQGPSVSMGWFDDTHALALKSWYWRKMDRPASGVAHPPGRAAHGACVLDLQAGGAAGGVGMLIFGGRASSGRVNDTWLLEGTSGQWTSPEANGTPPSPRSFHSCVSLRAPSATAAATTGEVGSGATPRMPTSFGIAAAIFGGLDGSSAHLNDLHLLHGVGVWNWVTVKQAGALPSPRGSAVATALTQPAGGASSTLLVFGGSACWDDERGGATEYLADGGIIDLGACLSALERAAAGEQPPAPAVTAAAAAESNVSAIGQKDAHSDTAEGAPSSARVVEGAKRALDDGPSPPTTVGAASGVSKRKKAMPVKRVQEALE